MKKFGLIAFIGAVIIGVAVASLVPFGTVSVKDVVSTFNNSVKGSGKTLTETRSVEDFSAVEVGGIFNVEIVAGKDFSVNVEADDNLLAYIETDVSGDTLEITTSERISSKNPITVRITAPDISIIKASGASKISLTEIKNSDLVIDQSGVSEITVAGETDKLNAELSGSSVLKARDLRSENVNIESSGASSAHVYAGTELTADATGASSVTYAGNPENVQKDISRASTITAE